MIVLKVKQVWDTNFVSLVTDEKKPVLLAKCNLDKQHIRIYQHEDPALKPFITDFISDMRKDLSGTLSVSYW